MKKQTIAAALAVALATSLGCAKRERNDNPSSTGKTIEAPSTDTVAPSTPRTDRPVVTPMTDDDLATAVADELPAERRSWVAASRTSLDALEIKAARARADLERAGAKASAKTRDALDNLDEKRKRLSTELGEIGNRSEAQWTEFKKDVDDMGDDLESAYNQVLEDLKSENDAVR